MKGYCQLTLAKRYEIFALKKAGHTQCAIARVVGVHPSTISRELRRNRSSSGYYAQAAQRNAHQRRRLSRRPTKWNRRLQRLIEGRLRVEWSPEQMVDWLATAHQITLSHERIYQFLRADQQAGGRWHQHLRRRLGPKRRRLVGPYKGTITDRIPIEHRPAIVDAKTRIGDWEADLMVGGYRGGALVTVVERKSRFTCIASVPSKHSHVVADALIALLRPFKGRVKTLTVDNGNEFAQHLKVSKALATQVYFAQPRGFNFEVQRLRSLYPRCICSLMPPVDWRPNITKAQSALN